MLMLLTQVFEVISENQHNSIPEDNKNVFKGERKWYRRKRTVKMQVYKTKIQRGCSNDSTKEEEWE